MKWDDKGGARTEAPCCCRGELTVWHRKLVFQLYRNNWLAATIIGNISWSDDNLDNREKYPSWIPRVWADVFKCLVFLLVTVQHWSNCLSYKTKKGRKPSRFGHVARRHNKCVCACVWTGNDHTIVYTWGNPFSLGPMFEFTGRACLVLSLHPRQHEEHPGENWGQQTRFHCQRTGGAVKASYWLILTRHTGDLKTGRVHPIWLKLFDDST